MSEVLYLRDEDTGELWSADARADPARRAATRSATARASSTFEHEHGGIATTLTLGHGARTPRSSSSLLARDQPRRPTPRRLTRHRVRRVDARRAARAHPAPGAHRVRRARAGRSSRRTPSTRSSPSTVAFCAMSEPVTGYTGDRREFLGRNGTLAAPAALARRRARRHDRRRRSIRAPRSSACSSSRPARRASSSSLLGAADGEDEARAAASSEYRRRRRARSAAVEQTVAALERAALGRSPCARRSPSFDAMLNRWSLYQALACRMWARSALYQSSGAYGFRDQLQDVMAFVYAEPALAREHILRAAGRQFVEGDVQHWWHPPERPRRAHPVLRRPRLAAVRRRPLRPRHRRRLACSTRRCRSSRMRAARAATSTRSTTCRRSSDEHGSVYEHCLRALRRGVHRRRARPAADRHRRLERRDEPRRASRAGARASGWPGSSSPRSAAFAEHAERAGRRGGRGASSGAQADAYATAVEAHGWDGEWYRRAYFDDGTPLGSAHERRVPDRLDRPELERHLRRGRPGAAARRRCGRSSEHLVREDARLLMLLTPPFDKTPHDPGLHQGLSARRARERRAVHPRRALGRARHRAPGRRRPGVRAVPDDQPAHPRAHAGGGRRLQGRAVRRRGRRVHRGGPRSAAAAGPGTPARRAGCTASGSRRSSASPSGGRRSAWIRGVPAGWAEFAIDYRYGARASTRSSVEQPAPRAARESGGHRSMGSTLDGGDDPAGGRRRRPSRS